MRALDRKLLRDLGRMKGQVVTISMVVACGVAVFVAALSTYDSLLWSQRQYYESARFAHVYANLKRAPSALERQIRAIPGVAEVETRLVYDVTLDLSGAAAPVVGRMIGVPEAGQPRLNRLYLRRGRLPEPGRATEIVISEGFAAANHLAPGDRLVALLNGHRETLQIVGAALSPEYIFALRGGDALPDDRQFGVVWISRAALASAFDMEGAFNDVAVLLTRHATERPVLDALDLLLTPYGGLGAYGRVQQVSHRFLSDEITQQEVMATSMPPVFLAVAVFLLHVVLGRIVTTQREQIAALKALGYDNLTVGLHYLKMACCIGLIGGVAGLALGAWLGKLMTANYVNFFHFPLLNFRVHPWLPLAAIGVSLVSAGVAALTAVRRVMRLAPAEAMRPPVPPRYQRSASERIRLLRRLSVRGHMVLRTMLHNPGRVALSCLGIAMAVPIVMVGLFWRDALDYMMEVQFSAVDRGDATVTFREPTPSQALREVARLPGVLRVEGMRFVPVRVRAGHRSYRTAVLGLPSDAVLRRLLDARLQVIPLTSGELLLSDRLGERLGVRAGDYVTVEVLEGSRARREVVVGKLVNEIIGMSSYMEIGALNQLMAERDMVSAVSVAFLPTHVAAIYAQLKQLPKVATVSMKHAALQSFRETTAQFVLVFTGILTVFAAAIAVGVVYNHARIALAERAWELASLRVLGLTRAEVSALLLSELGLQLLVAIPLGMWLGYWFIEALVTYHQTEMFRIPAVISPRSYALAGLLVLTAGVMSALLVRRRLDRLDLVSVLKTRE